MENLFDLVDKALANILEVDVQKFIDTIDEFNDTDMEFIIHTLLDSESSDEQKTKAKELFKTKL